MGVRRRERKGRRAKARLADSEEVRANRSGGRLGKASRNFRYYAKSFEVERYLEIGTWAGGSLFWVLENMRPRVAYAIDPYPGSWRHTFETSQRIGDEVEDRWADEFPHVHGKLIRQSSHDVLPDKAHEWREYFDFILVDGCHHGLDVFMDAAHVMRMVKPGGILVFDDFSMTHIDLRLSLRLVVDTLQRIAQDEFIVIRKNIHLALQRRHTPWPDTIQKRHSTIGDSLLTEGER